MEELHLLLQEKEASLQQAAQAGQQLLVEVQRQSQVIEELESSKGNLADQVDKAHQQVVQISGELEQQTEEMFSLRQQLQQLQERQQSHAEAEKLHEMLKEELVEAEDVATQLSRENEVLSTQLLQSQQALQAQKRKNQEDAQSQSAQFEAVSKEELRDELMQMALQAEAAQKREESAVGKMEQMETTVDSLMRQCQQLQDQVRELEANKEQAVDDLNTSLFDEILEKKGKQEEQPLVDSSSEEELIQAPGPKLFADMNIVKEGAKDEATRQFRDYVYMTCTAVKIEMAIEYSKGDRAKAVLALQPGRIYTAALAEQVPMHRVHQFVVQFCTKYLEEAERKPPDASPVKATLVNRVLNYFPAAEYLWRKEQVVMNTGSDLGSFLWKRGSFINKSWKRRWCKLNSERGLISYHSAPHVMSSLGTILLSDCAILEIHSKPIVESDGSRKFVFKITTRQGRVYEMAAPTLANFELWCDGIREKCPLSLKVRKV